MKIGIDLDSTLNTLDEEWAKWIAIHHDPTFTVEKWTNWDVDKLVPAGKAVFDYLWIPGVFGRLKKQPWSFEVTERLAKEHELFIVTTTHANCWPEKHAWLMANYPHIKPANFIVTSRKGLIKLDILIDDGAHNFDTFGGRKFLLNKPWNQHVVGVERMADWVDIGKELGVL